MRYIVVLATAELLGSAEGAYWIVDTQSTPKAIVLRCASLTLANSVATTLNGV